jgi:catechol 2,3-dioxygenase-like lactoylglutathione lyase family enzyme
MASEWKYWDVVIAMAGFLVQCGLGYLGLKRTHWEHRAGFFGLMVVGFLFTCIAVQRGIDSTDKRPAQLNTIQQNIETPPSLNVKVTPAQRSKMILGIDNIGVAARDLDRSVTFYQTLGFSKTFQNERGVTMTASSAKLFIFKAMSQEMSPRNISLAANPPGIDHISLLVDDVDRAYAELMARGISFLTEPADQTWGARTAVTRDPDGNNLYLLKWLPRK